MKKKAISALVLAAALVIAPMSGKLVMITTATGNNSTVSSSGTTNTPVYTATGNNTVVNNNTGATTNNTGTTTNNTGATTNNTGTTTNNTGTTTTASGSTYTVVKGDTLYGIARKCGMTLQELLAANPQIKNRDKISVGQVLNCKAGAAVNTGNTAAQTPAVTTSNTYTVVKGDTLYGIAKKCKMTIKELLAANPQIKNRDKIKVGQVINVK